MAGHSVTIEGVLPSSDELELFLLMVCAFDRIHPGCRFKIGLSGNRLSVEQAQALLHEFANITVMRKQ